MCGLPGTELPTVWRCSCGSSTLTGIGLPSGYSFPEGLSGSCLGERVQGTVEVVDPVVQIALEPLGQAMPVLGSGAHRM